MLQCVLNRILIRLEDLKRKHDLGDGRSLEIAYGPSLEKQYRASITEGEVVSIGPSAFSDYKLSDGQEYHPVKIGDRVLVAKFSPRTVIDPDMPSETLALINDEDVLAIITSKEKTNE